MKLSNNSLNIIYLCHAEKGPSGGAKIIYKHSDLINKLKKRFTSQVLHIKKKKSKKWSNSLSKVFRSKGPKYTGWSSKDITVKKDFKFTNAHSLSAIEKILIEFINDDKKVEEYALEFERLSKHLISGMNIVNDTSLSKFIQV